MKKLFLLSIACLSLFPLLAQHRFGTDVLGEPFEYTTIHQPNDYEGKVNCTLIHRKEETRNYAAVLYVHGFNDYFFQKEMADKFHMQGITFYAIDLRKYGRSWLPTQKMNNVRDLSEYDADLDTALNLIKSFGHQRILLMGHSTGGLIVTLYAAKNKGKEKFDAVICNSPFYDFNVPFLLKKFGVSHYAKVGLKNPDKIIKENVPPYYGESMHIAYRGEWNYILNWKSNIPYDVNCGWVRAIYLGQQKLKKGLSIGKPILIMRSDLSIHDKKWSDRFYTGDAVLSVEDIHKGYEKIDAVKIELVFHKGMHDLVLSKPEVRKKVYEDMFIWIQKYF